MGRVGGGRGWAPFTHPAGWPAAPGAEQGGAMHHAILRTLQGVSWDGKMFESVTRRERRRSDGEMALECRQKQTLLSPRS